MYKITNKDIDTMFQYKKLLLIAVFTTFSAFSNAFDFEPCNSEYCVKVFKDFKKYSKKGHPSAMETLGNFYIVGYGTEKSKSKALKMYKKAAKWDQGSAQYKIGLIYTSGDKDDASKGIRYLERAVKNKAYEAAYVLGVIYMEGKIVEQDNEKARQWLEVASKYNQPKATYLLAQMYDTQVFGEDQQAKAIPLYNKVAFKLESAKERLIELNQPLPPGNDDDIERIVVNPQDLQQFFDEQLEILRNTPSPKIGTGSRVSKLTCAQKISCASLSGESASRLHTEVQRAIGMAIANSFRQVN